MWKWFTWLKSTHFFQCMYSVSHDFYYLPLEDDQTAYVAACRAFWIIMLQYNLDWFGLSCHITKRPCHWSTTSFIIDNSMITYSLIIMQHLLLAPTLNQIWFLVLRIKHVRTYFVLLYLELVCIFFVFIV